MITQEMVPGWYNPDNNEVLIKYPDWAYVNNDAYIQDGWWTTYNGKVYHFGEDNEYEIYRLMIVTSGGIGWQDIIEPFDYTVVDHMYVLTHLEEYIMESLL